MPPKKQKPRGRVATHTRNANSMRMRMPMPTPTPVNRMRMPMPTPTRMPTVAATAKAKPNLFGLLPHGILDDSLHILSNKQMKDFNLLTRNNLVSIPKKRFPNTTLKFADEKISNNIIDTLTKLYDMTNLHTLILDNVEFDKGLHIKGLFREFNNDDEQLEKIVVRNMRFDDNLIGFLSNIKHINLLELETIRNLGQKDIITDDNKIGHFVKDKGITHTTRIGFYTASQFVPLSSLRNLRRSFATSSSSSSSSKK